MSEFKYWAFLSYSHQDNVAERQDGTRGAMRWAEWLHRELETYRVPRELRGRTLPTGEPMPERFVPVFQDEKELPVNSDLSGVIRAALEQSRFLIFIGSPRSAKSFYCNEEVRSFKQMGRGGHVLALIVDGEPNASAGNKEGFTIEDECFASALRHPLEANGEVDLTRRDAQEPIAADVRVKGARLAREMRAGERRTQRELLDFMKLKLLAALMGVGFDELVQRDKARQRRAQRQRLALVSVIMLIVASLAVFAVMEARRANVSEQHAIEDASRANEDFARMLLARGESGPALARLAEALRQNPRNRTAATFALNLLLDREWPLPESSPMPSDLKLLGAVESPDGARLLVWPGDRALLLCDAKTGATLAPPLVHEEKLWSANFSRDGRHVLSTAGDRTARVWDAKTGAELEKYAFPDAAATSAAWAADGKHLMTVTAGKYARIWDAATGQAVTEPLMHPTVSIADVSMDGGRVVTGAQDGSIRFWDATTSQPIGKPVQHSLMVLGLAFCPDGQSVYSAGTDSMVRRWNATTGEAAGEPFVLSGPVWSIRFTRAGERMALRTVDGIVTLWDTATGRQMGSPIDPRGPGFSAIFSSDGEYLLVPARGGLERWAVGTGRALPELVTRRLLTTEAGVSPDERHVVLGAWDSKARIFATDGRATNVELTGHKGALTTAEFSADGTRVVTASWDKTARIWDAQTGASVGEPLAHEAIVHAATFSPDGAHVATVTQNGAVTLWDAHTGAKTLSLPKNRTDVYTIAFRPDGAAFATGGADAQANIWDAATGRLLTGPFKHDDGIRAVAFSPDGRTLATTASDRTARLWDVKTGQPLLDPLAHPDWVLCAAWGAAEYHMPLATGCRDGIVRVWDPSSGKLLAEIGSLGSKFTWGGEILGLQWSRHEPRLYVTMASGVQSVRFGVLAEAPPALAEICEGIGGKKLDPTSGRLMDSQLGSLLKLRDQLPRKPADADFTKVADWFLSPRATRKIDPWSTHNRTAWMAERLAVEPPDGVVETLDELLHVDANSPELLRRLSEKLREKEPARARLLESITAVK